MKNTCYPVIFAALPTCRRPLLYAAVSTRLPAILYLDGTPLFREHGRGRRADSGWLFLPRFRYLPPQPALPAHGPSSLLHTFYPPRAF